MEYGQAQPYKECPKFQVCSCNECPLDYLMLSRPGMDGEEECCARRSTREAIAARYPDLPTHGLTHREVVRDKRSAVSKARWEALSPEEKERRLSSTRRFLPSNK